MMGLRTPAKKAASENPPNSSPQGTGSPEEKRVRRSVGEWEAGLAGHSESRKSFSPSKTITKPKPIRQPTLTKGTAMTINLDSPTTVNCRIAEARRCLG